MFHDERVPFYVRAASRAGGQQEKVSYPWLFFHPRRPFVLGLLTTTSVCAGAFLLSLWYVRSGHEAEARSPFGIWYGVIGTGFVVAAAIGFSVRRRQRRRVVGRLNGLLQWHIFLGVMGVLVLALHSFGHVQHLSGEAALYSLIVLSLSGGVGKVLDHVLPRLLAIEVAQAMTQGGEDVVPAVARQVTTEPIAKERELRAIILQDAVHGSLQAIRREQLYRGVLRYWRLVHIALAVITGAITCWHIAYAVQVLLGS